MVDPNKLFGRLGNRLFQMAFVHSQMKEGIIPDIYVQDYKLFVKYEKEIKEWFGEGIGYIPYVSIHIRRGDYVDNPFYVDLSKTDYYERAIEMFPDKQFLVFSDDTEYAKMYFHNREGFTVVEGQSEIDDFNMAASCEGHIIANSSFSWWYAYVCPNPAKKVIYPKQWFTDGVKRVTFPPTWQEI